MPNPQQFSLPLRVVGGSFATTEQGTPAELAGRVNVLCHTPPGWLAGRPGFGLADQRFRRGGADLAEIQRQITTFIGDADALLEQDPSTLAQGLASLGVRVSAR